MSRPHRVSPFHLLASLLLLPAVARADDMVVDMFQSAFLPQAVTIEEGDSVRWQWQRGTHTVTSGLPDGAPGTPDEPGLLFDAVVDEAHPEFLHVYETARADAYPFFCRQHPEQIGLVQVTRGEISFRVAVLDNIFNPEEAFIFAGDSIRWEHEPMEDFHTVTSGLSSDPADNPGALFDADSSDDFPLFVHRFDDPGHYPYFCRPHETDGMRGVIRVQEVFVRGDASPDGTTDISDPIATLNFLFLGTPGGCCADAMDANDDGVVDLSDPIFTLNFLFQGRGQMPAPWPRPGGDRTEDLLLCCPGGAGSG